MSRFSNVLELGSPRTMSLSPVRTPAIADRGWQPAPVVLARKGLGDGALGVEGVVAGAGVAAAEKRRARRLAGSEKWRGCRASCHGVGTWSPTAAGMRVIKLVEKHL